MYYQKGSVYHFLILAAVTPLRHFLFLSYSTFGPSRAGYFSVLYYVNLHTLPTDILSDLTTMVEMVANEVAIAMEVELFTHLIPLTTQWGRLRMISTEVRQLIYWI